MRSISILICLVLIFATACQTRRANAPRNPVRIEAPSEDRVHAKDSYDEVRHRPRAAASKAIRDGKFYICEAGGYAVYACGISEIDWPLVEKLPRRTLPSGCSNPKTPE
jgi:hypothetical protein